MSTKDAGGFSYSPHDQRTDSEKAGSNLTSFQLNLLITVARKSRKGLAIRDELETYYGTEINHGRIYPNLDELAEKGLIDKGKINDRTNVYRVTGDGRDVLAYRRNWITDALALAPNDEEASG